MFRYGFNTQSAIRTNIINVYVLRGLIWFYAGFCSSTTLSLSLRCSAIVEKILWSENLLFLLISKSIE